jgi:mannonate dehydratase
LNRRQFLAAACAPVLLSGCNQFSFEQGVMNECRRPDPERLAKNPLVAAAWSGLRPDRVWDVHAHLFGNGRGGSGVFVDPAFEGGWGPASRIRHAFFMNAACAGREDRGIDGQVVVRLTQLADSMPEGAKLMLLAFDFTYDETGKRRSDQTTFSVPNEHAQRVARSRPDRFEWIASVHPYREDAVSALEQAKAGGARAVKWLPPTMAIDLAHPRCIPFYDALVRLDLPLLVHMGEEKAVHGAGRDDLADPLLVRHPLDRGVRVIVAHCASLGASNFAAFEQLMAEKRHQGRLFGDLSAVTQANRNGVVAKIIAHREWEGRLLNGSDYPLPGILPLFSLREFVKDGLLAEGAVGMLRELRETHSILFDFVLKRNLAYQGMKLPDSAFETRGFFERVA